MAPQGLTGQYYLEIDYMEPERYPPPAVSWRPQYHYIPSATSAITYITESITNLVGQLEKTDFPGLITELQANLTSFRELLGEVDGAKLSEQARATLASLTETSDQMREAIAGARLDRISSETTRLLAATRGMMDSSRENVEALGGELLDTVKVVRQLSDRIDIYLSSPKAGEDLDNLRQTIVAMREAAHDLPADVERTLTRVERLLEAQRHDMEQIV
jgi:paraquat-inducible protein B